MATPTGPGRDHSLAAAQRDVEHMAKTIAADVAKLETRTIQAVLPALLEARDELRAGLAEWLAKADGAKTFAAQDLRRGLVSIEGALEAIRQMAPDLESAMGHAFAEAGGMAAGHLREELARFGRHFGETIRPTQIASSAIVARAKHEIIPRIHSSSHRYVGNVRTDMRHQLAVGLARGETFTQMTNRLRRLGGPRGMVALRGVRGEPGAYVEEIAEGLFNRYRHWAERVVRTEVLNAYNVEHIEGIKELNDDLEDDGDEPLMLKWDSSPDKRICALCRSLDGRVTKVGKPFAEGIGQPPAHPNCRCVVVAWHPSWGGIDGEMKPKSAAPGVKIPTSTKEKGSRRILSAEKRAQASALSEITREKKRPMASSFHPNMTDPNNVATPQARRRIEAQLERTFGQQIPLEEISHGFAVPDGFEARLRSLGPDIVSWDIHDRATGKFAGELTRDFGTSPSGKTFVHHSMLDIEPAYQRRGISDVVNGNALRHYEKWGVQQAQLNAAWAGRYAWARLGFKFRNPRVMLTAFERYVDRHPVLADQKSDLMIVAEQFVREPHKLASWRLPSVLLPDEFNKPAKGQAPAQLELGEAFLLSKDTPSWDGYLDINRKDSGYLTAIVRTRVKRR